MKKSNRRSHSLQYIAESGVRPDEESVMASAVVSGNDCVFKVHGHDYDMNPLTHEYGDRETVYGLTTDGGRIYVNFCDRTTVICADPTNVCVLTPDFKYVPRGGNGTAVGMTVGPLEVQGYGVDGLTATYTTTEKCNATDFYTTKVHVVCRARHHPLVISVTGTTDSCLMEMIVGSKYGCKEDPGPCSDSSSSSSSAPQSQSQSHSSQKSHSSHGLSSSSTMVSASLVSVVLVILAVLLL